MLGTLICLIILAIVALPWWERLHDSKEKMFQMQLNHDRHIAELELCYGSEQHFLDIVDDEEHIASISVEPETKQGVSTEERYGER